VHNIEVLLDS